MGIVVDKPPSFFGAATFNGQHEFFSMGYVWTPSMQQLQLDIAGCGCESVATRRPGWYKLSRWLFWMFIKRQENMVPSGKLTVCY